MTRFLSEALQAPEPFFRLGLRRLESANGNPNTDIRFSADVLQAAKAKLLELGLDPHDTTPAELYHVLQQRLAEADRKLTRGLRTLAASHVSAEADVMAGMIHALRAQPVQKHCYALKTSRLKALLKQNPPKKAMKRLGYRSLDSMLKHEPAVMVLAAAWLSESAGWRGRFLDRYKQLQAKDFENRTIEISLADSKRWQRLAGEVVSRSRHNVLCFKELGTVVFLPLPADAPAGAVTASLALGLHELNEIRAASSFLKLAQVRADFGQLVRTVASDEPRLSSELFDQPVPWNLVQRYYSRLGEEFKADIFEPYLEQTDMAWHAVEDALAELEPDFKFWRQTAHLGWMHDRRPVSMNLVDCALNLCNDLPFERRAAHYFQRSLWHELLLRYLHPQPVEQAVLAELQPELADEYAA